MGYTYYSPVEKEGHYLFAKELAVMFSNLSKLKTFSGKPPVGLVREFLNDQAEQAGEDPLYYETRNGLVRVYPQGERLVKALVAVANKIKTKKRVDLTLNGKTYHLKRFAEWEMGRDI